MTYTIIYVIDKGNNTKGGGGANLYGFIFKTGALPFPQKKFLLITFKMGNLTKFKELM
jgi:hypothetical protein